MILFSVLRYACIFTATVNRNTVAAAARLQNIGAVSKYTYHMRNLANIDIIALTNTSLVAHRRMQIVWLNYHISHNKSPNLCVVFQMPYVQVALSNWWQCNSEANQGATCYNISSKIQPPFTQQSYLLIMQYTKILIETAEHISVFSWKNDRHWQRIWI